MSRIYNSIKDFVFIMLYFVSWFVPGIFLLLMTLLILDITVIDAIEEYYMKKLKAEERVLEDNLKILNEIREDINQGR